MPPSPPKKPPTHQKSSPQNHRVFDPWNSSSTGHQRAENPYYGTTSWRDTRSAKLKQQFRGGDCSRDTAGALDDQDFSAKAFDGTCGSVSPVVERYGGRTRAGEWRWVSEEEAKRARLGVKDIRCFMGVGKRKAVGEDKVQLHSGKKAKTVSGGDGNAIPSTIPTPTPTTVTVPKTSTTSTITTTSTGTTEPLSNPKSESDTDHPRQKSTTTATPSSSTLFTGTTIYINGSTLPQISDHKLKSLLASHGAAIAIGMARRTVTHVIIGQPGTTGQGAGGGLAAGKLQGEIERGGWKGVRVVGVDW